MKTLRIAFLAAGALHVSACRPASLSRDDAQEALIALAGTQGDPINMTIPDLRAGKKIRYLTGKEEGVSPWTWNVDLTKKSFNWFLAAGRSFYEIHGEFQKDGAKWKAVITGSSQT